MNPEDSLGDVDSCDIRFFFGFRAELGMAKTQISETNG
jgi:hypothetical protein